MKRKILLITLLSIFVLGICINGVAASHTFKAGKYKIKITDKQYKKLKKATHGSYYGVTKKTGKYYTVKTGSKKGKKIPIKIEVGADRMQGAYLVVDHEYYDNKGRHYKRYAFKKLKI